MQWCPCHLVILSSGAVYSVRFPLVIVSPNQKMVGMHMEFRPAVALRQRLLARAAPAQPERREHDQQHKHKWVQPYERMPE